MQENKAILKSLADNAELFAAVKATVLEQFIEVPYAEGASDELLGQIFRARSAGRQKVEAAFVAIAAHKSVKENPQDKQNPAY